MGYKWGMVRNTAIGAAAGYVAAGSVSESLGRSHAANEGAFIGGVIGSATGLPFGKLARMSLQTGKVLGRGLKASPESKLGAVLRGGDKLVTGSGVVFRRIRGRIIPIRVK